ncbi:MAG: AAC(3) family N-acetyltransferase [Candidatus Aminicenantes bacterium]|nr:AAC(3) family N-acetyltransferase [Candidatus Aminicenantes bacterium]
MAETSLNTLSSPRSITRSHLTRDLARLGVRKGDCVMLHSSLSSLGWVEGGAATVVEAFLEAMGPEGTLLTPAFTGGAWTEHMALPDCRGVCPQEFCPSRWASREGAIPNAALQRPGRLRGCHPTHSWIANGARRRDALRGQRDCPTPCGRGNPFEKVVEWDGCIVILGVGVDTITLWHYYEDLLEVGYLGYYHPEARHLSYCATGKRIQYDFPGVMQDVVRASGIMTTGQVGRSESGLIRARVFRRFMATIMADDPDCFVLRPADAVNGDLAADALAKGACGNPRAAGFAGIAVRRRILIVMLFTGAIAGLGGMLQLSAPGAQAMNAGFSAQFGLSGFIVAALAGASFWGVIGGGMFIASMFYAGIVLQTKGLSVYIIFAVYGVILTGIALGEIAARYRVVRRDGDDADGRSDEVVDEQASQGAGP